MATTTLGNKATGSIIKLKENGTLVDFYVACHNYEQSLNGACKRLGKLLHAVLAEQHL